MRYTHKITDLALEIWDSEDKQNKAPFLKQPYWPNGEGWGSEKEISDWAAAKITELLDPKSEFVAGSGPNEPLELRKEIVEIDSATISPEQAALDYQAVVDKLAALGLTIQEVKLATGA
jgi:hypothetical protein